MGGLRRTHLMGPAASGWLTGLDSRHLAAWYVVLECRRRATSGFSDSQTLRSKSIGKCSTTAKKGFAMKIGAPWIGPEQAQLVTEGSCISAVPSRAGWLAIAADNFQLLYCQCSTAPPPLPAPPRVPAESAPWTRWPSCCDGPRAAVHPQRVRGRGGRRQQRGPCMPQADPGRVRVHDMPRHDANADDDSSMRPHLLFALHPPLRGVESPVRRVPGLPGEGVCGEPDQQSQPGASHRRAGESEDAATGAGAQPGSASAPGAPPASATAGGQRPGGSIRNDGGGSAGGQPVRLQRRYPAPIEPLGYSGL
eukprot:SAG22_NODE_255_length_13562_cov_6.101463_7_plen_308_part_00